MILAGKIKFPQKSSVLKSPQNIDALVKSALNQTC